MVLHRFVGGAITPMCVFAAFHNRTFSFRVITFKMHLLGKLKEKLVADILNLIVSSPLSNKCNSPSIFRHKERPTYSVLWRCDVWATIEFLGLQYMLLVLVPLSNFSSILDSSMI